MKNQSNIIISAAAAATIICFFLPWTFWNVVLTQVPITGLQLALGQLDVPVQVIQARPLLFLSLGAALLFAGMVALNELGRLPDRLEAAIVAFMAVLSLTVFYQNVLATPPIGGWALGFGGLLLIAADLAVLVGAYLNIVQKNLW